MRILFPAFKAGLGNGFLTLLLLVAFEEKVKGLSIDSSFARGGAYISAATGKHGLRIREFEAGQILLPGILPGQGRKASSGLNGLKILFQIFRL